MKDDKKKDSKVNKFLVGVLIGSAVGSILGLTMAPKSGKETREDIAKGTRETVDKIKDIVEKRSQKKTGFWHFLNRLFTGKKSDED